MKRQLPTFDELRERSEVNGTEWLYGAVQTDLALIPVLQRLQYAPKGVLQFNNVMDTNGCASRSVLNIAEAKLDYFYDHDMHPGIKKWCDDKGYRANGRFELCDAFIEILSGTTPQGNSLKAPLDTFYRFGAIPAALIPLKDNMTWDEYMDKSRVTEAHKDLGKAFLKRIQWNYEQVKATDFPTSLQEDLLHVAAHAWPSAVNGIYPRTDAPFNHAFATATPEIDALDNYEPFIKRLSKSYKFFDWGYSLSITSQNPYPEETIALFEVLQKNGLLAFFAEAIKRLLAEPVQEAQKKTPVPMPITKRESLYNLAKSCLDSDIAETQNELGCAEAVSYLLHTLGVPGFPRAGFLSTTNLFTWLKANTEQVLAPLPGDIIISPTGFSTKGSAHGHVGVCGFHGVMSNNSMNGLWQQYYTDLSWKAYYHDKLGFPVLYFRLK